MQMTWDVGLGLAILGLAALPSSRITRTILVLCRWLLRIAIGCVVAFAAVTVFEPVLAGSIEETIQQFLSEERNSFVIMILLPTAGVILTGLVLHALLGVAIGDSGIFLISGVESADGSKQPRAATVKPLSPREALTEITGTTRQQPGRNRRRLSDVVNS